MSNPAPSNHPTFGRLALAILGVAMLCSISGAAQQSELSPYSRYGFGLIGQLQAPAYAGMGGMETTMLTGFQFQPNNPASATYLSQTTFQASGIGNQLQLKQGEASASAAFGSPGPFGIVVKRNGGKNALILNLSPYSNSGYAITLSDTYDGIGSVNQRYEGDGGLSALNIGWARVFKGSKRVPAGNDSLRIQSNALHLGIQTHHLFGQISRTSTVDIIDPTFLDHRNRFTAQHRSITANAGIVYDQLLHVRYNDRGDFEQSLSLRMGGVFTPSTNLHSSLVSIDETTQTLGGIPVPLDTAFYSERLDYRARMPRSFSLGSSFHFDRGDGMRVAAGIEYKASAWDDVAADFAPEMQSDGVEWMAAESMHLGLQFNLGSPEQRHPTWGKATYRLGVNRQRQPYAVNGHQVQTQTITGGFTLPLVGSRSLSRLHFGTEVGERFTQEGALEETFFRFHFGVSLMPFFKNNWLIPRLYD
jgi:hypothetical protein